MFSWNIQLIGLPSHLSDTVYMVQFGKMLCLIHIDPTHSGLKASPELIKMLRALLRLFWGNDRLHWYNSGSLRSCTSQDFKEEEVTNLSATYMNVQYRNALATLLFKSLTVHVQLMVVTFLHWSAQKTNGADLFYSMKTALAIFYKNFHIIVF